MVKLYSITVYKKFHLSIFFTLIVPLFLFFSFFLLIPASATGACVDSGPDSAIGEIQLKKIVSGITSPVFLTHAGNGSKLLYVVSQKGTIYILQGNKILKKPFLKINEKVSFGGEMGLLGLAFHPKFKENRRFFVNYTSSIGGLHTVIAEFKATNSFRADKNSQRILLKVNQPYSNHNGGCIMFGPDGYLYVGMGDGGSANDPENRAQNLKRLLGKFLRIDVDKREGNLRYGIPKDNPFININGARPEIWAYGMRNPWRFSFDIKTGRLYAGDVGQDTREEIDIVERGKNYGWRIMEGRICTPGVNPQCDTSGLTLPIIDYGREDGFTVIGGYVYIGNQIPELCGVYIYGDYGSGNIWGLRFDGEKVTKNKLLIKSSGFNISSFGEDEDGEIYVVDLNGTIAKIKAVK